jgi:hypothetical protein
MCSVENNPAKRAKIDATPVADARPSNGFRSYSSIVYPAAEAFVSAPAPDFTAPGNQHYLIVCELPINGAFLNKVFHVTICVDYFAKAAGRG